MAVSESDPAAIPIPVDLFVSKKHHAYKHGLLCFVDSYDNIIYKINRRSSLGSSSSPSNKRVLFDAAGTPLLSIHHNHKGSWKCLKGDGENEELIFRVQRAKSTMTTTELEVFFAEYSEDSAPNLQVKGSPCQRNCTIYRGNDIVAQTSLMYKLNQIFVRRGKFRLTIFPGSIDHALIVALIVIFLHKRRLCN